MISFQGTLKQHTYMFPKPTTPALLQAKILHCWDHDIKMSMIHNAARAYPETMARIIKVNGRHVEKERIMNVIWDRMDNAPNANAP